jgi:hypothetical protein
VSPVFLAPLPEDHILRNTPLEGAFVRLWPLVSHDVTDSPEKVAAIRQRREAGERKATPWKQVRGWPVGKVCYNQLGSVWTENVEWTFDEPKRFK